MNEDTKSIIEAIKELAKRVDDLERSGGKRTVWETSRIIEAKKEMAESLKNTGCRIVAMGPEWHDKEKLKEYKKLMGEIKELNIQISNR